MQAISTDRARGFVKSRHASVHRFTRLALRYLYKNTACPTLVHAGVVRVLVAHLFSEESS